MSGLDGIGKTVQVDHRKVFSISPLPSAHRVSIAVLETVRLRVSANRRCELGHEADRWDQLAAAVSQVMRTEALS